MSINKQEGEARYQMAITIAKHILRITDAVEQYNRTASAALEQDRKGVMLATLDICSNLCSAIGDNAGATAIIALKARFRQQPDAGLAEHAARMHPKPHLSLVE